MMRGAIASARRRFSGFRREYFPSDADRRARVAKALLEHQCLAAEPLAQIAKLSLGQLHVTLGRMEADKQINSYMAGDDGRTRGRSFRMYFLTSGGVERPTADAVP